MSVNFTLLFLFLWLSQCGSNGSLQAGENPRDIPTSDIKLEKAAKGCWSEKLSMCWTTILCLKLDSECKLFLRNLFSRNGLRFRLNFLHGSVQSKATTTSYKKQTKRWDVANQLVHLHFTCYCTSNSCYLILETAEFQNWMKGKLPEIYQLLHNMEKDRNCNFIYLFIVNVFMLEAVSYITQTSLF